MDNIGLKLEPKYCPFTYIFGLVSLCGLFSEGGSCLVVNTTGKGFEGSGPVSQDRKHP